MLRTFCGLALTLLLAGCGTGGLGEQEAASSADGALLFQQRCGRCHTLAAAGTPGGIGPNLDDAFAAAREEGFDESTIREVVLGQMRYPYPLMPGPDTLFPNKKTRDAEMAAVASYVASVAANREAIRQARAASDPKSLFTASCSSCHTLADAGSTGTIGPNLDRSTRDLAGIVKQITNGGGGMPAFRGRLTDQQIKALAEYVAKVRKG